MFGIPAEAFGLMAAAGVLIDLGIVIAVGIGLGGKRRRLLEPAQESL